MLDITIHKHYIQKTIRQGCIVSGIYYTKRPPANPPCQFESGQPLNISHNYYWSGTNICISNQNSQKFPCSNWYGPGSRRCSFEIELYFKNLVCKLIPSCQFESGYSPKYRITTREPTLAFRNRTLARIHTATGRRCIGFKSVCNLKIWCTNLINSAIWKRILRHNTCTLTLGLTLELQNVFPLWSILPRVCGYQRLVYKLIRQR